MIYRKNKTNKLDKLARILAGAIVSSPLPAVAEDAVQQEPARQEQRVEVKQEKQPAISGFVEINTVSKYIYRGFRYSDKAVIWGTLGLSSPHIPGLTLMGFTNFDTKTGKFNETDVIVDYTKSLGKGVNLSLGYSFLHFPNTDFADTSEICAGVSLETLLNPSLSVHYDWRDGSGVYAEACVSHDTKVLGIPVSLKTALAYNNQYFREGEGLSHLESTLSFHISTGKNITITPFVAHSHSLDDEIETQTYGGVKACWSF